MKPSKHYSRTPLTEAVIEVKIEPKDDLVLADLENAFTSVKELYSKREELYTGEFQVPLEKKVNLKVNATQSHVGYQFTNTDGKQIFQSRLDGFSFSRLAPYERWETFSAEAHKLWNLYRSLVQPKFFTRVGVRYISKLDLPLPFNDFSEYLLTLPVVSPKLPQGLNKYVMQLEIPKDELLSLITLTEVMLPFTEPDAKTVSIILDIDVGRTQELENGETWLWNFFEELRICKNEIFEESITDKMRSLIE